MRRLMVIGCSIGALLGGGRLSATEPALTVVPFAVPVAVPVAVVQRPTVFYGYSQYATPTVSAATNAASAEQTKTPVADAPGSLRDLRSDVAALLARRCAECHSGPTARGELALFDADARLLDALPRQAVVEACAPDDGAAPTMPPADRPRLSIEEQALLQRWAKPPRTLRY